MVVIIEYGGKKYRVGNTYTLTMNGYRMRKNNEETPPRQVKVKAKLVLRKYEDGEGYATNYHYGFIFEYKREWNGVTRIDDITLPDGIGEQDV